MNFQADPNYLGESRDEKAVSVVESREVQRFELVCSELANKNARRILHEISNGCRSSSEIHVRTGLTIQDVIYHLNRLESVGLVETIKDKDLRGWFSPGLRGRTPRLYVIARAAILLIPNEIIPENESKTNNVRAHLRKSLSKKCKHILWTRKGSMACLTIVFGLAYFLALYLSEPGAAIAQLPVYQGAMPSLINPVAHALVDKGSPLEIMYGIGILLGSISLGVLVWKRVKQSYRL